jgi:phage/plasmid primase-like uncharacterized protein
MMTNYPEGVTGSEYEISGPMAEYTVNVYVPCGSCGQEHDYEVDVQYYDNTEFGTWTCVYCEYDNHFERCPDYADWND